MSGEAAGQPAQIRQNQSGDRGSGQTTDRPEGGNGEERLRDAAQQHSPRGDHGVAEQAASLLGEPPQGSGERGPRVRDAAGAAVFARPTERDQDEWIQLLPTTIYQRVARYLSLVVFSLYELKYTKYCVPNTNRLI